MRETMEFQEIDTRTATERELRALHELSVEGEREVLPDDPAEPFEEFLAGVRSQPSYARTRWWLAWDEAWTGLLGGSRFRAEYKEENRHIGRVSVSVRREFRRRGLGSRLLVPAMEAAREDGRTLLTGHAFDGGPGVGFCDAMGAETPLLDYHNRLTLAEVDVPMLHRWVERAKERSSAYSLMFWEGPCPEERIGAFAGLMAVMNTAPHSASEEDWVFTPEIVAEWEALAAAQGWVPWTYIARHEETGEWAGYTRIFPSHFRPEFAYQEDTGVRVEHRDRGLGRWLKAAMLIRLLAQRPGTRWVDTWNATSNEAMLSINLALGFKPIVTWQMREIAAEKLAAWLALPQ